jgi:hypothetical protein
VESEADGCSQSAAQCGTHRIDRDDSVRFFAKYLWLVSVSVPAEAFDPRVIVGNSIRLASGVELGDALG